MCNEDIAKRAIKGDDKAFEILINTCKENLYRTAFSYVRNEQNALDIVQETVYKAYLSIEKLREPKYFNTWITRILINNTLDYIKKNKNLVYFEDNELIDKIGTEDNENDRRMYIWEAIDTLESKQREVIVLKYFDDLTIAEISKVLDYPIGTVKTYLNKGLVKLRKFMGKDWEI